LHGRQILVQRTVYVACSEILILCAQASPVVRGACRDASSLRCETILNDHSSITTVLNSPVVGNGEAGKHESKDDGSTHFD